MKHLLDFVFLAILVDVMLCGTRWNRQALQWRLGLLGLYIATATAFWLAGHWLLIPRRLEHLSAQVYLFTMLALYGAMRRLHSERLRGNPEQEPLLLAIGILTPLGIPLLAYAGRTSFQDYLLSAAAAGAGWLIVSYVINSLGAELHAERVPRLVRGRAGLLIIAGLFYWALMGFFNVLLI